MANFACTLSHRIHLHRMVTGSPVIARALRAIWSRRSNAPRVSCN